MKKVFLLAAAAIFTIGAANMSAQRPQRQGKQGGNGTEQRSQRMDPAARDAQIIKMMKDSLGINATQEAKIKAIQKDYQAKLTAVRAKFADESTRDAAREEMRKLMESQNTEVKAVLDAKQKTKYEAMLAKMREKMGNRAGGDRNQGSQQNGQRRPRGGNN